MADNWTLDITNEGIERLKLAMQIAFSGAAGSKATHYCDHTKLGLVLLWSDDKSIDGEPVQRLPFPLLNPEAAAQFAWSWLQSANYEKEPDIDGSVKKGWRVYNEAWGHVGRSFYAFVAIKPEWSLYGK